MQKKTTGSGLTGFWMQVGRNGSVQIKNGTMYKLLSAKRANTLTHILSRRFVLRSLRALLYAKRKDRRADNAKSSYPRTYGLIGLKTNYARAGLGISMTSQKFAKRKGQVGMRQNTSLSRPFSNLIGLRDGSACATLKAFHQRRKGRQTQ